MNSDPISRLRKVADESGNKIGLVSIPVEELRALIAEHRCMEAAMSQQRKQPPDENGNTVEDDIGHEDAMTMPQQPIHADRPAETETLLQMRETAQELGYPSVLEALEALAAMHQQPIHADEVEQGYWGPDVDGDWIITALGSGLEFAVSDEEKARAICTALLVSNRSEP